jgi:hypothetical protein
MADIIIAALREEAVFHDKNRDPREEVVVLHVRRVAGGRPAGQRGMLELVDVPNTMPRKRKLDFTPLRSRRILGATEERSEESAGCAEGVDGAIDRGLEARGADVPPSS